MPLFGCPTPDVGSQGVSPFLFFGFGGFRIKPHFWSWIESDFLPTLFCQVFPRASSCSSSFDPKKSFLTLLGTLQKFKSPSSRALAVFLKGQHHCSTSFDRSPYWSKSRGCTHFTWASMPAISLHCQPSLSHLNNFLLLIPYII